VQVSNSLDAHGLQSNAVLWPDWCVWISWGRAGFTWTAWGSRSDSLCARL